MRTALKNKQLLKYALFEGKTPNYVYDDDGNIKYDIAGNPMRTGDKKNTYSAPVDFWGNIAFAGGESEAASFGVAIGDYDSKLLMNFGEIPISETSLIFKESSPEYDSYGNLKEKSADFRVVKVQPSLHYIAYLLKRIEK